VVDSNLDGRLDRRELFTMLRAYLVMLHVLSYESNRAPIEDMFKIVDEGATELAATIFVGSKRRKKDTVSFEEFAQYYSENGGYNAAPWLELLNVNKFLDGGQGAGSSTTTTGVSKSHDDNSKVVFAFQLGGDETLEVLGQDVKAITRIAQACAFCELTPEDLVRKIIEFVETKDATRRQFGDFITQFAYKQDCSDADKTLISSHLIRLFDCLTIDTETCATEQLSIALTILASGSKSAKLVLAWWALCSSKNDTQEPSGRGQLPAASKKSLRAFLSTLLASVFAFVSQARSETQTRQVVASAMAETSDKIFTDLDVEDDGHLSFEQFGAWYSSSGRWFYLLDCWKDKPNSLMIH